MQTKTPNYAITNGRGSLPTYSDHMSQFISVYDQPKQPAAATNVIAMLIVLRPASSEGYLDFGLTRLEDNLWMSFESGILEERMGHPAEQIIDSALEGVTGDLGTGRSRLKGSLWLSFKAEPLEDGMDHLADKVIADALQSSIPEVLDWLHSFSLDSDHVWFASSVLRCLGRQESPGSEDWRARLVMDALASDELEIRAAAVDAAGAWLDPWMGPDVDHHIISVLKRHVEQDQWLAQYIQDLIKAAEGE